MAEPEVPPTELFMYASWESCEKILGGLSLKATPPNALNDPFECLPGGYEGVTDGRIQDAVTDTDRLSRVRSEMIRLGQTPTEVDQFISESTSGANLSDTCDAIRAGVEANDFTDLLRNLSARYGIICFAETPDCLLMWSHYADRHRGVVIGFSPSRLAGGNGPFWLKVRYWFQRPRVLFRAEAEAQMKESVTRVVRTKAPCWAYESEWRLVVRLGDCVSPAPASAWRHLWGLLNRKPSQSPMSVVHLWPFPRGAVTRVILGCRAGQHDEALSALVQRTVPSARIEKAEIRPGSFRLDVVTVPPVTRPSPLVAPPTVR